MTVFDFLQANGRLPKLETEQPWTFKGWLLPYLMPLPRWQYYLQIINDEQLPPEPIPQIHFGAPDKQVINQLDAWARIIGWDVGGWSDFRTLLEWLSFAIGTEPELPKLKDETHEKLYREVDLCPMAKTPYDYFGAWISEHKANGWNPTAFFPTPHNVVELLVQMQFHDAKTDNPERDSRTLSVMDCCVGTGRMLLHASNYSLNLWGTDIDPVVLMATKINGALYAPWLTFPIPKAILGIADAPAEPVGVASIPSHECEFGADRRGQLLLF